MKLQFKSSDQDLLSSITARRVDIPHMEVDWHFHEEYELIYFMKGQGMRIVGDHISNFKKGELVLVGQWLPHLWRNDEVDSELVSTDFIVIKFTRIFGDIDLFMIPELLKLKILLKVADQGILFSEDTRKLVHDDMLKISSAVASEKLILLLTILNTLVKNDNYQTLSGPSFSIPKQIAGENRLHKVINHISINFAQNIPLGEISRLAVMTPPSFCRFFKKRTNKTFSLFVNELRISKACQLLINGEQSINQICYDVGFSSLTNFNRNFRNFKGVSPSIYRNSYNNFRHYNLKDC